MYFQLVPDYDRESNPSVIPSKFHYDIDVISRILRLRVSFKWRPLIDHNVTETLRQWTTAGPTERPCLIFLSWLISDKYFKRLLKMAIMKELDLL